MSSLPAPPAPQNEHSSIFLVIARLLRKIAEGDTAAEAELVEAYSTFLGTALRSALPKSELDDVLQNIWCYVLPALRAGTVQRPQLFSHWLLRVARSERMLYLRRRHPIEHMERHHSVDLPDNEASAMPLTVFEQKRLTRLVLDMLRNIKSPLSRKAMQMVAEGATNAEVAAALGISATKVAHIVHYHRGRLRHKLGPRYLDILETLS